MDYTKVLGEYINKKEARKIDFKQVKKHTLYRDNLYTYNGEDYVISNSREELQNLLITFSQRRAEDYPPKLAKKYTHKKYLKAKEKKAEEFRHEDKKYYLIKL